MDFDNINAQIKAMRDGVEAYKLNFKIGMYEGLAEFAALMERKIKEMDLATGWFNEPVGRTPGDLETTYSGYVAPMAQDIGTSSFVKSGGLMRHWAEKPMEAEEKILDRQDQVRTFTELAWDKHQLVVKEPLEAIPFVAMAILSSPMIYARRMEDREFDSLRAHPRLLVVMGELEGEFNNIMSRAIRRRQVKSTV